MRSNDIRRNKYLARKDSGESGPARIKDLRENLQAVLAEMPEQFPMHVQNGLIQPRQEI
jgi:hypothetical protein